MILITKIVDDETADELGVKRFSRAMRRKLAQKRLEGYGGWNRPRRCSQRRLVALLRSHIKKGDTIDIANFCMMIWNRREAAKYESDE